MPEIPIILYKTSLLFFFSHKNGINIKYDSTPENQDIPINPFLMDIPSFNPNMGNKFIILNLSMTPISIKSIHPPTIL